MFRAACAHTIFKLSSGLVAMTAPKLSLKQLYGSANPLTPSAYGFCWRCPRPLVTVNQGVHRRNKYAFEADSVRGAVARRSNDLPGRR